jgi:NADPH-dependent 2,4-dienoyl-CoA reductase/sulfur reductase-like enzyme
MKIIIIGGVAGGATAAARLRRNSESAQIVLVERGPYISFANCGLPYHISGAIAEREQLLVTSAEAFHDRYRVDVRTRTEAIAIDRAAKTVRLRNLETGEEYDEAYDRVLLSPGAEPVRPRLPGIESPRIFSLRNIPDLDRMMAHLHGQAAAPRGCRRRWLHRHRSRREPARTWPLRYAGRRRGTRSSPRWTRKWPPSSMPTCARSRSSFTSRPRLSASKTRATTPSSTSHNGKRLQADLIVLAIGVRPETTLARAAGLELGTSGGIHVNERLQTSDPAIYAVGDAIEVTQSISGKQVLIPLAGPANRQGRMAADNMLGGERAAYKGTLGTAILKAFDLAAGSTGLNEKQLQAAGIEYLSSITHGGSHASYYPGAMPHSASNCSTRRMAVSWARRRSVPTVPTSASTSSPRPSTPACRSTISPSWNSPTPRPSAPRKTRSTSPATSPTTYCAANSA